MKTTSVSNLSLAAALLFAGAASAFEGHAPFVWWSKAPSASVGADSTYQLYMDRPQLHGAISSVLDRCQPAVIVFDQPGLHVSDYAKLPETSAFKDLAAHSKAVVSVDYVRGGVDVDAIVSNLRQKCQAEVVQLDASSAAGFKFEPSQKTQVVVVRLAKDVGLTRADEIAGKIVKSVESAVGDDFAAVLTSSTSVESTTHKLVRRAPSPPSSRNSGGLFGTFVIFGPGVWMGFVTISVIFPIILTAVVLLSGIQTPIRFEKKPKNIK